VTTPINQALAHQLAALAGTIVALDRGLPELAAVHARASMIKPVEIYSTASLRDYGTDALRAIAQWATHFKVPVVKTTTWLECIVPLPCGPLKVWADLPATLLADLDQPPENGWTGEQLLNVHALLVARTTNAKRDHANLGGSDA
jgi:hypothetical protein